MATSAAFGRVGTEPSHGVIGRCRGESPTQPNSTEALWRPFKPEVTGSIPVAPTRRIPGVSSGSYREGVAGPLEQLGAYAALAAMVGVLVLGALCLSMRRVLNDLRRRQTREERLREFLDEAAAAFEDADMTLSEMAVDLLSPGRSPGLRESVARAVFAVKSMRHRVGMRFPAEHPLSVAYGEVEQAVDARASYLIRNRRRLGEGETMTEGEETHDNELREEARVAFGRFASAARDEVALAVAEPERR